MSFAASYQQEANEAWLNDLLTGIIDPNHRPESRSVSRQTRNIVSPSDQGDVTERPRAITQQSHFSGSSRRSFSPFSWRSQSSRGRPGRSRSHNDPRATLRSPYDESPERVQRNTLTPSVIGSDARSVLSSVQPPQSKYEQQRALVSPVSPVTVPERASSRLSTLSVPDRALSRLSDTRTVVSQGGTQTHNLKAIMESPNLSDTDSISAIGSVDNEKVAFAPHPAVRPLATRSSSRELLGHAAPPEEDENHKYPGPLPLGLIIVGICLSVFIISVDRNIVTTAIPEITAAFESYGEVGWYGSAYFLTASAFQPLYGRVYMTFNVRWTFLAALAVFETGSIIGGVSPTSDVLILGRAIQGLGSAGILTGSFVVGTHSVRMQKRPVLFAFVGILYGVGALCGPLLGGILTDLVTWRWIFWINLPIGAVTFISVFFFFKPPKKDDSTNTPPWIERILQLDLIGNAILLGACVQLFIALELSQTKGNWDNAPCIGLITGFGVTVIIFVAWLFYKGDKALIPPRIIRQRTVAASCGAAFFIYGALLLQAFYLPIWFQAIKGTDAITSGVNMIPYMLTNALFSLLAGVFVSQNGLFAPPAIIGCAIGTIGSGLLATLQPDSSLGHWFGFEVLISAGLGMAIQQGFSAVQTALPLGEVPIGTAAVVAAQSLGGAVFVSVGNTVLQDHLLSQTNQQAIPGVDLRAIFQLGATKFRQFVPPEQLPAVVNLYNSSLQGVFISAVPLCGCAFLCSLCMEWRSVKKSDAAQAEAVAVERNTAAGMENQDNETY